MLRCRTCKTRFSEPKDTPLFDARLPTEKVTAALAHVAEGIGTRKTAPTPSPDIPAAQALAASELHDELVAFPPKSAEVQFDEKWAFVSKKQKNCQPDDATCGDCWDHVALDPESRLVVSLVVGKRTFDATHALVRDFRRRTCTRLMRLVTSGEYPVYADAIRAVYEWLTYPAVQRK